MDNYEKLLKNLGDSRENLEKYQKEVEAVDVDRLKVLDLLFVCLESGYLSKNVMNSFEEACKDFGVDKIITEILDYVSLYHEDLNIDADTMKHVIKMSIRKKYRDCTLTPEEQAFKNMVKDKKVKTVYKMQDSYRILTYDKHEESTCSFDVSLKNLRKGVVKFIVNDQGILDVQKILDKFQPTEPKIRRNLIMFYDIVSDKNIIVAELSNYDKVADEYHPLIFRNYTRFFIGQEKDLEVITNLRRYDMSTIIKSPHKLSKETAKEERYNEFKNWRVKNEAE